MNLSQLSSAWKLAKSFRSNAGIGMDGIEFAFIGEATGQSVTELAGILNDIVRQLAFPVQLLVVMENLIAKKDGGTRCTALCTSLFRLVMAAFKPMLRKWDVRVALENEYIEIEKNAT